MNIKITFIIFAVCTGLSLLFVFIASGGGMWSRLHFTLSTLPEFDFDFGLQRVVLNGESLSYSDLINTLPSDSVTIHEIQRGGVGTSAMLALAGIFGSVLIAFGLLIYPFRKLTAWHNFVYVLGTLYVLWLTLAWVIWRAVAHPELLQIETNLSGTSNPNAASPSLGWCFALTVVSWLFGMVGVAMVFKMYRDQSSQSSNDMPEQSYKQIDEGYKPPNY